MFRLLKLLAYGLLGYAIYEFIRGAMGNEIGQMFAQGGGQFGQGGQGGGTSRNMRDDAARANMTGSGEGSMQESLENDGGSVPHAVGRGVVSRG